MSPKTTFSRWNSWLESTYQFRKILSGFTSIVKLAKLLLKPGHAGSFFQSQGGACRQFCTQVDPILLMHFSKCVSNLLQYLLPRCQRKRGVILYQCEQISFEVFVNENALFFDLVNVNAKTGMTFKLGLKLLQMLQDGL